MGRTRITGAWIACVLLLFAGGQAQAEDGQDKGVALLQAVDVDVVHGTVSLNDEKYRVGSFTALEDEHGGRLSLAQLPARLAQASSKGGLMSDELAVWYEVGERGRSGLRPLLRLRFTEKGMPR